MKGKFKYIRKKYLINMRQKPTRESHFTKYLVRAIKRIAKVVVWLFILFLVVMGVIWVVPKVWKFVFG